LKILIVLPRREMDIVAEGLEQLTEALAKAGYDISGGFLGGEFGYGGYYDSPLWTMRPFCWCEKDDCPWCRQEDPAPNFLHRPSGMKVWWYKYIGRDMRFESVGNWPAILAECLADIKTKGGPP
jgi:hypothetical protein